MSSRPRHSKPWWQGQLFIAASLLLFFPLGLVLMWRYAPWRPGYKLAWTILVPAISLSLIVIAIGLNDGATDGPRVATVATATPASASSEEEAAEADPPATKPSDGQPSLPAVALEPGILYVFFARVGLGDAIYIRTPTGEDVIIDGADSPNELSSFLDRLGETSIDVVIASHPHADHIGGLPRVVRERKVGAVWTNGQTYTTKLYRDLEAAIDSSGAVRHAGKVGDSFSLGAVTFSFLGPSKIGSNLNDNSLVVRMDCGSSSFLFAGDAEESEEDQMILSGQALDVDVLKLGHHGSRTSTSSEMIVATTPILAIYSAIPGNQFGHPHQETLDRLAKAQVPVDGTGAAGDTVVVSTACDDTFSVSPPFPGFPSIPALAQQSPAAPAMPGPISTPRPATPTRN